MTINVKEFAAFAINHFGDGDHPMADDTTMKNFNPEYVLKCIQRAIDSDKLSDDAAEIARKIVRAEIVETRKTYAVWCEVWGGITGTRASWLKGKHGAQEYDTLEEAEKMAAIMNENMNNRPNRTAVFEYTAKEYH